VATILCAIAAVFLAPQRYSSRRTAAAPAKTARISFSTAPNRQVAQNLGVAPWTFEPNVGQSDSQVEFTARARDASVFLTKDSIYFSWAAAQKRSRHSSHVGRDSLRIQFAGAELDAKAVGENELRVKTNYLFGRSPAQWHTNIVNYAAVRYPTLYPGVGARIYGSASGLEYDLRAQRGADLRQIALRIRGAKLALDRQGDLVMRTSGHTLVMKRPRIYQPEDGSLQRISGGYRMLSDGNIGFAIGKHRAALPVIIDPIISVTYTTFLGGAGEEKGDSVAVDSAGAVYVGGTTTVPNFPGDSTPVNDGGASGSSALFVAKIDPAQTGAASLVYLTFIGGSGAERGGIVAVDNSAVPPNLALLGWTTSTDFPVTDNSVLNGPSDLTVTELNGTGSAPVYSKYFGGSGAEATQNAGGIATNAAGDVFVTSDTTSADLPIANSTTAFQPAYGGGASDGFLAEFAPGSSTATTPGSLLYSTYLGIDAQVGSTGVAVDTSGHVYITGFTSSPAAFPSSNAFQAGYAGGAFDAFVMEIDPTRVGSSALVYASLLGGSDSDQATAIALDTMTPPNAYVVGVTQSPDLIPPTGVTNAPFQSSLAGNSNGFLAVIHHSTGTPVLQYLSYLGGAGSDVAQGVAVVSPSQVYIAGTTTSANFPVICPLQGFSGTQDAFVAEFNPSVGGTSSLLSTTFLGGTVTAEANGIASGASGDAIVFGDTISPDYPLAGNPNTGFQLTCPSCAATPPLSDAFLTAVNANANPAGCVAFNPSVVKMGSFAQGATSPPLNVLVTNDGSAPLNITNMTVTGANSIDFSLTNNSCLSNSPVAPAGTCSFTITFTPSTIGAESAQVQVSDDGIASPQTLALDGTGTGVGITLSPTSLSFPNTAQGQIDPNSMAVTITNTGTDVLSISSSQIQGADAKDFSLLGSSTCTASVSPGAMCTIVVQFAPNEPNPPQALAAQAVVSLLDNTNQATQTITIPLSGTETAPTPAIVFSPPSLAFSGQNVGSATASQSVTVTNNGSSPLAISSIGVSGADSGDFSQTNTCPIAPVATIAINATCTIFVAFRPTATGPRVADLSVADNASASPQTVALTGTGTAAGVSLMPASLIFGGQNPGTPPSAPQTITLQNTGTGPLTISNISITGANAADFAETNNCPVGPAATLSAQHSCAISVTFDPTVTGPRSASLAISDDFVPSPQILGLSGTGTAPVVSFVQSTLQFGSTLLRAQAGNQPVQLSNTGNGPLVITRVGLTGINPGDFTVSGSCVGASGQSISLAPASTCTIEVNFVPTAIGSRNAALIVTDNASGSPQQVALLAGTGTDFQLGAIAGGSTSVTITAGETATFNMQVTDQGFSGAPALSCANPIPAATCTIAPTQVTVAANQSASFTVTLTSTSRGAAVPWNPRFVGGPHGRLPMILAFSAFALLAIFARRYRWPRFAPILALLAGFMLASCGGTTGGAPSLNATPPGNYTVTISAAVPGATRTVNLAVTVQ
jgi:hypothetical protein